MEIDILLYLMVSISLLCWGSFLNVLGYRLIRGTNIVPRSSCPHCNNTLAWYDLIPVASYCVLKGKCRQCETRISPLYPFIELLSLLVLGLTLTSTDSRYLLGYFVFFSALIVSIRSDLETMFLSRWATLYMVPVGWVLASLGYLPLSLQQSIMGSIGGYLMLWTIRTLFYMVTKKEGMGEGDLDLLCLIGAFTGLTGAWSTMILGSMLGALISLVYLASTRQSYATPLPFGPFLAAGAIIHVLLPHNPIIALLF